MEISSSNDHNCRFVCTCEIRSYRGLQYREINKIWVCTNGNLRGRTILHERECGATTRPTYLAGKQLEAKKMLCVSHTDTHTHTQ